MINWHDEALSILRQCKQCDPKFYSESKFDGMAQQWARVFERSRFHPNSLRNGVTRFYEHDTEGERPTAGQIVAHTKRHRDEYYETTEGRAWLEARIREAEQRRDEELANGTWRPGKGIYG